mmetsp:Transcript_124240/g.356975  ORF Transcript_124240/g.356975 Transcript_124240/m.356975 type:complete len:277 (-) Transcript_124240:132-962(-)
MSETHRSLPPQPSERARSLPVPRGAIATGSWSSTSRLNGPVGNIGHCSKAVRIHVTVPSPPQTSNRVSKGLTAKEHLSGAAAMLKRPSCAMASSTRRLIVDSGSLPLLTSHTSPSTAFRLSNTSSSEPISAASAFMIRSPVCSPLREFTNATTLRLEGRVSLKVWQKVNSCSFSNCEGILDLNGRSMPPKVRDNSWERITPLDRNGTWIGTVSTPDVQDRATCRRRLRCQSDRVSNGLVLKQLLASETASPSLPASAALSRFLRISYKDAAVLGSV